MRLVLVVGVVGAGVLAAGSASAQTASGFALDRFDPSDRGSEWFAADSLDLRGHLRPAAGVVGSWGYKPLVVYEPNGDERGAVVRHQIVTHLGGSLVLWDRLRGGLNLPLALYQEGDAPRAASIRTRDPKSAFGDLRLAADVRVRGVHGDPFQAAVGAALFLPTGSRDQYTSDGNARFAPRASAQGDISMFTYAARLAFEYRGLTERFDGRPLGSTFTFTAAAGVRVADGKLVVGPELYATTVTTPGSFFEKTTTPVEGLLGAHYAYADFRFGAGIGTGLTRGWGSPVFRTLLAAEWAPELAKPAPPPPPEPPPPPPEPPPPPPEPPAEPPPPPPEPPPPPPDRDGDGILDAADACPDVPGPPDPDPKKNGCPLARLEDGQVKITQQVKFKTASAEILPESDPVLKAIADILRDHPEVTKVRVEGHTDNRGTPGYNKELSDKRASSVATWLIRAGVARDRLSSQGFGLERPLDNNATEEGRQNNRRVELHVVETKKLEPKNGGAAAPPP